jgi:DNA-binding PadR family transcriptional regulator
VRKYYKITTRGQKELVGAKDDLDELKKIYAFIIKEAV